MNKNIPKKIHFIWFGKEMPWHIKYYISLNKQMYKGWKIKVWTEKDFDPKTQAYTKKALKEKKYAFISDYLRTKILYEEGGIYLDTDMVPIKNVENLLNGKIIMGFEYRKMITTGFVAAEKNQPFFKRILDIYEGYEFLEKDFKFIVNNEMWTIILKDIYHLKLNNKFQALPADIIVYPISYFSLMTLNEDSVFLHDHKLSWTTERKAKVMNFMLRNIRKFEKSFELILILTEKLYFKKNKKRFNDIAKAEEKFNSNKKSNDKKR